MPAGKPLAGMVHHKMHDVSGPRSAPRRTRTSRARAVRQHGRDAEPGGDARAGARVSGRASTRPFRRSCLKAAETRLGGRQSQSRSSPAEEINGGGAYGDSKVDDEFYWAAAELFVTTGKPEYKRNVADVAAAQAVPDGCRRGGGVRRHELASTDALGAISLATVPSGRRGGMQALRASASSRPRTST